MICIGWTAYLPTGVAAIGLQGVSHDKAVIRHHVLMKNINTKCAVHRGCYQVHQHNSLLSVFREYVIHLSIWQEMVSQFVDRCWPAFYKDIPCRDPGTIVQTPRRHGASCPYRHSCKYWQVYANTQRRSWNLHHSTLNKGINSLIKYASRGLSRTLLTRSVNVWGISDEPTGLKTASQLFAMKRFNPKLALLDI